MSDHTLYVGSSGYVTFTSTITSSSTGTQYITFTEPWTYRYRYTTNEMFYDTVKGRWYSNYEEYLKKSMLNENVKVL